MPDPETSTPEPISVLVIDDHQMFAESLARLLSDHDDIEVVGVASRGSEGVSLAAELAPQVVLVDFSMPDKDGVAVALEIKTHSPGTFVVMLTGSAEDSLLLRAIEAGCSGFLTKDRAAGEVANAVRSVADGEALISPVLLARLLPRLTRTQRSLGSDLTDRERDVLALVARGMANKAVANELNLSLNTIRNYVQAVLTKLGAHSKLEAVSIAVREGIIDYPAGT